MKTVAEQIYEIERDRYYGNGESPYEFECRMWEATHPGAMIRWEKLPGELRLEELKSRVIIQHHNEGIGDI